MNDFELLREFVERESETAFAELVRRHLGMVYSAAMRQTGDRDVAEDVTQAVFILLARKGPHLDSTVVVPGWLYRTASFLARQAATARARRRMKEKEAMEMNAADESEEVWREVAPHLDSALAELAEPDRNALILRYLQERCLREVGESLGISEEAARKRVGRGIERLRHILRRQGVTIAATGLAAVLGERSVEAMPRTLPPATVQAGVTFGLSSSDLSRDLAAGAPSSPREPLGRSTRPVAGLTVAGVVGLTLWTGHFWRGLSGQIRLASNPGREDRAKASARPGLACGGRRDRRTGRRRADQ
jgi:RNA polymerase sigma factor (sigma-70 family)